ncbi:N-acetylmannosamine-6-phosphate 2-epimerase [Leptolyngbya sp. KIOST-1]|uniref:N-acetylmannosamine-6-phosphate 2-epimerase n=1 Tax=Leptolyngbya sp. KIOST-1 TaxID=1229172 RepID=UPI00056430AC|nr:N-acetylmannosamine-6-phosphate 2-epimerase [Leptolyngbya sp. KIOST-1]
MKTILKALQGGLVVSCQAPANSPLHDAEVIAAIAAATLNRGAVGVRIDSPGHILAVRSRCSSPIIGLWKQVMPPSPVYITPQFHHAEAVAQAGADIIAVDATQRPRPGDETLSLLIHRIREQLGKPVMADVDTLDNARQAVAAGADCVGTTLFGYTEATENQTPPGFDLLRAMVAECPVPVICEGGIASPAQARQALDLGAYAVVVGTAITGIDSLVMSYLQAVKTSDT